MVSTWIIYKFQTTLASVFTVHPSSVNGAIDSYVSETK